MNLQKHLDRAAQSLQNGQADFAAELCDQVLDFAPGERRAAELFAQAALALAEKPSLISKLGAMSGGLAAKFSRLTRNPDAEARQMRRAFLKNPNDLAKGIAWGDALERAGYAGAALGAFGGLSERSGEAAKRAGVLAAAQGEVEAALDYYEMALKVNPRDTEAMRARKNLAAEKALRARPKDGGGSGLDTEAFLRAARGEPLEGDGR
ncbi:MAG: tetratricopeptide repeat protein [Planctomycetota bacterium]|nr:tetratricopeptide repeat protein [Planctomycetota bacterium]